MKSLLPLALAAALAAPAAHASWFSDRFIDPEDGQFDMSNFLLDHRGALIVPIIITEPAVGYGGGFAMAFFSETLRDAASRKTAGGRVVPPNIYGGAIFGTENGTKGGALGGRFTFREDTIRYRGGVMSVDVNLDYYGTGNLIPGFKVGFNMDGWATFNEVTHRLGNTDHFLGGRWLYTDFKVGLSGATSDGAGIPSRDLDMKASGLGVTYGYDSRDNIFFTHKGIEASIDAMFYSPSIGSDTKFEAYRGHAFAYIPVNKDFTTALRVDGRAARGEVPFYQYPFVDMRGIPAMRYQDENVGVTEVELRYNVTSRWIAIAFIGAARTWGRSTSFSAGDNVVSKGVGFRYILARRLGLAAGIDIARGPEDTTWYIQVGNAWR